MDSPFDDMMDALELLIAAAKRVRHFRALEVSLDSSGREFVTIALRPLTRGEMFGTVGGDRHEAPEDCDDPDHPIT